MYKLASPWEKYFGYTFRDFFNEIWVPIIFAFVIMLMDMVVKPALEPVRPWDSILTFGFIENIMIYGLPIFLGIGYNRWAGGATGFLFSWMWVVSTALWYPVDPNLGPEINRFNFQANPSWLGYVVSSMMTGYLAGALNYGSQSIKRCITSGVVAAWSMSFFRFIPFIIYSPMYCAFGTPGCYGPFLGWSGELSNLFQLYMNSYFIVGGVWGLEGAVFGRIMLMMKPAYGPAGAGTFQHGG